MDDDLLKQYKELDWNKLLRRNLGEYSLEKSKEDFNITRKIFDDVIAYAELNAMPEDYIADMNDTLRNWLDLCGEIISFTDTTQKGYYINRIRQEKFDITAGLTEVMICMQMFDANKNERLNETTRVYDEKIKQLDEKLKKTEKLLESSQVTATKREVSEYGNFFGKEAGANKENAKNNFWFMIVSIVITALVAVFILWGINFVSADKGILLDLLNTINSQNILLKFVVISLGAFLIAHFSKVHAAEKHLYNINTQKQNALESHNKLLNSVIATESENEKEIRNAILLELTRAIFDAKDTGYLKGYSQNSTPTNSIVEISRTISK